MKPEKYRENAIRYLSEGYDPECRERLLSGEDTPHTVHELPIIEAHIAGAHSRDEEVSKLEKALHNVNEWCHQLRNKVYELRHPWISVEKRLPETGADIIYLMNSGTPGRNERYRKFDAEWFRMNVRHWQYANDPELKKGE